MPFIGNAIAIGNRRGGGIPTPIGPDGAPSNLVLTVISDTSLKLDWTNGSTNEDNLIVERSPNNSTWVEIAYPLAGLSTYTNISLIQGTLYYYRVRAIKGSLYSSYSNTVSATTYSYFTTTWQTENAGSATKTIVVPTTGAGYDCWIEWGDGSAEENKVGTPGNITHIYPTTGIKTVKIRGIFPRIFFNNGGDKLKLLTIANWGSIVWSSMSRAFYGCANLTGTYSDIPNTSSVTTMDQMFDGCTVFNSAVAFNTVAVTNMLSMFSSCLAFNQSVATFNTTNVTVMESMFYDCEHFNQSVANFNTANVTTMLAMFQACYVFNQSVANFNTANVTTMLNMFVICSVFNQDVSGWNVINVTNMTNLFNMANLSTANYDALLITWSAQAVKNHVPFHCGSTKYTGGGAAATARAHLVLDDGSGGHHWAITDGGPV